MRAELKKLKVNDDERGNLVAIEALSDISFPIKRIFYIYGNKNSLPRAGHANKECEQACVCLAGSCLVRLNDGKEKMEINLNQPDNLLQIHKYVWVEIENFSSDCVLLVLSSELFNKDDYINNFDVFKELVK